MAIIDFAGKTVVVTGAARGIGTAIARSMAALRGHVALLDIDGAALESVTDELRSGGHSVEALAGDVTDAAFARGVVEKLVSERGGVDVLVNNAGVIRDNFLEQISEDDWDTVLSVNLKGPFVCCRAVTPHMRERRYGKIVNIASRAALGNVGQANYSASKGGLISLTRTLALELARFDINVNAVAPGLIDTPMTQGLAPKVRERLLRMQPGGRAGSVTDVANAVCFLASDAANFVTGQVLYVDGGRSTGLLSL